VGTPIDGHQQPIALAHNAHATRTRADFDGEIHV
jgi:hypothetical protein